jgi:hypothetical protein
MHELLSDEIKHPDATKFGSTTSAVERVRTSYMVALVKNAVMCVLVRVGHRNDSTNGLLACNGFETVTWWRSASNFHNPCTGKLIVAL